MKLLLKLNSLIVNKVVKIKSDKINMRTDKKYLLISSKSKLTSEKNNLFLYIFFGLLNDKIWLTEYINKE